MGTLGGHRGSFLWGLEYGFNFDRKSTLNLKFYHQETMGQKTAKNGLLLGQMGGEVYTSAGGHLTWRLSNFVIDQSYSRESAFRWSTYRGGVPRWWSQQQMIVTGYILCYVLMIFSENHSHVFTSCYLLPCPRFPLLAAKAALHWQQQHLQDHHDRHTSICSSKCDQIPFHNA